jgi:hypothetical protein
VEGAHVLPHTLNASEDGQLTERGVHMWTIANLFRPGISHMVLRYKIEDPRNAMLLLHDLHVELQKNRMFTTSKQDPETLPYV